MQNLAFYTILERNIQNEIMKTIWIYKANISPYTFFCSRQRNETNGELQQRQTHKFK